MRVACKFTTMFDKICSGYGIAQVNDNCYTLHGCVQNKKNLCTDNLIKKYGDKLRESQ